MTPRAIGFDEQANAFWFHILKISGFRHKCNDPAAERSVSLNNFKLH
jgi:hypothetical protein